MFYLLSHYYVTRIFEFFLPTQLSTANNSNGLIINLLQEYFPIIIVIVILLLVATIFFLRRNAQNQEFNTEQVETEKNACTFKNHGINATNSISSSNITRKDVVNTSYLEDVELVAILTAAIVAYEGNDISPDELIIRSIRRVNKRNHTNEYNSYRI